MVDIVLRHVTYVISFNPHLIPWQVRAIAPLLLSRQLGDRELYVIQPKQQSKQQRENSNSDVSDFKAPNFTALYWSPTI